MKKRFVAGILAASYFTVTSVTPVFAKPDQSVGQTTIIDEESTTIDKKIESDGTYGVLVVASDKNTGAMEVHITNDVEVSVDDIDHKEQYVAGVAVENNRQDDKSDVTVTVDGDIDLDNEVEMFSPNGEGLKTDNYSNSALTVTTGSITSYSGMFENNTSGIHNTAASGETNITVNGDVKASYNGEVDNPDETDTTVSIGLISDTNNQIENGSASTTITINGALSAESAKSVAQGGSLSSQGTNAVTDLTVTGSVTATSDEFVATGLEAFSKDGVVRADIKEDITATGELGANGILTYLEGTQSLTEINVEGSITAEGEGAMAILINQDANAQEVSDSESSVSIRVGGDVNSSSYGIVDLDQVNGGQTNVLIEGKLVSEGPAVVVMKEAAENLNLTVWKIETKDEHIAMEDHMDADAEYSDTAKKVEESIQYILKVEENQEDLISLGQSKTQTWTNLDGTTSTHHVAHENERVAVKLNVPNGYKVDKAYSDTKKTDLLRDESGNYYLIVPRGGGVILSVKLVADDSADDNGGGENGNGGNGNGIYDYTGSDDGDDSYNGPEVVPTAEIKIAPQTTAAAETVVLVADANGEAAITLETVSVSEGVASVTFSENLSNASITSESLNELLSTGAAELKISTSAGEFSLSSEKLTELAGMYTNLRFVVNGNQLLVFADNADTPVLTIEAAATSGLTV